jgi:hypothetical protein
MTFALALGLLIAVGMAAASPDDAAASRIVYSCAPDLCAVDPESGASSAITSDGGELGYLYPSISRDGRRIAAARASAVVVGDYGANLTAPWGGTRNMNDVAISPDGSAVGESHSYVETRYGCPLTGGCLELVDRSKTFFQVGPDPAAFFDSVRGGGGVGFLGRGSLLSSYYDINTDTHTICAVADPTVDDSPCEPRVVSTMTLFAPAGSPDGRLIAAAVAGSSEQAAVNLYDAGTGALVRQLAAAGSDPAFSPDGKEVAYSGADGWVHVVPTGGGPARRLVKGLGPTWGAGEGPGPAVGSAPLRYRQGRLLVELRCAGKAPCRGTLRVKRGKLTLGARPFRVKAEKSATVRVKTTGKGEDRLEQSLPKRVTVQLKPRGGRWVTKRLALRR